MIREDLRSNRMKPKHRKFLIALKDDKYLQDLHEEGERIAERYAEEAVFFSKKIDKIKEKANNEGRIFWQNVVKHLAEKELISKDTAKVLLSDLEGTNKESNININIDGGAIFYEELEKEENPLEKFFRNL